MLEASDDAATVNWGGKWRMPTTEEQQELLDKCTWTWTTQNGVNGYKVTGPNNNSIFLPAAGYCDATNLNYAGNVGYYWSSSFDTSLSYYAHYLFFKSDYHGMIVGYRCDGRSIRPVQSGKDNTEAANERTFNVPGNGKYVTFKMIRVEHDTFMMGATDEQGSNADYDEKPAHSVTISRDYWMGETEVTQALWYAVMGQKPTTNGSQWDSTYGAGDNRPAYYVSWDDCQEFLTALNQKLAGKLGSGEQFRLPTEAEWEFAARGGNQSKHYKYAGSNTIGDVAWYYDNSYFKGNNSPDYGTHDVRTKAPNELGFYDMSGNVWEWCQDYYSSNYYSNFPTTDPVNNVLSSARLYRGGSWSSFAGYCRVSNRGSWDADGRIFNLGLRLALQ